MGDDTPDVDDTAVICTRCLASRHPDQEDAPHTCTPRT